MEINLLLANPIEIQYSWGKIILGPVGKITLKDFLLIFEGLTWDLFCSLLIMGNSFYLLKLFSNLFCLIQSKFKKTFFFVKSAIQAYFFYYVKKATYVIST